MQSIQQQPRLSRALTNANTKGNDDESH
ncbi:hypothetical phage protein [Burkholderia cenocepacia J2315]|uniref:Hypothetical phage protein n=1 Tax=Burkholderia cenocepacia (strain ATCC BAA-245 / DSM 16553 / LMG 16656 / NCTC 13227 / J2315 / CF5610) TaxID=216591 RepID=B4EFQ3_BURCJ|nr:hypothetical phage protein [Burkholderia cenocepacia J2315]